MRYILLFSDALFLGHGFGAIPAPGSFADSALFGSSRKIFGSAPRFFVPLRKSVGSLWEQRPLAFQCPESLGGKKGDFEMYLIVKWNSFGKSFSFDLID